MPPEDFIINIYCLVDDRLLKLLKNKKLRQRGFAPKLSDSEVITMEIVGEFLGKDADKGIWTYFKTHWFHLFPKLGSRANFAKQSSNLWQVKKSMQTMQAYRLGAFGDDIDMADGFPMSSVHFKRAPSSKLFQTEASYGYCALKAETYYGFKGNICMSSEGIVTAANVDERLSLYETAQGISGLLLADKGLIGEE